MNNPFEDYNAEIDNPYKNVNNVLSGTTPQDYNPFQAQNPEPKPQGTLQTITNYADKVIGNMSFAHLTESDILAREEALRQREERIAAKEREVELARQNGTMESLAPHPKNWPPYLKLYSYYPEEDLPQSAQKLNKAIYWIFVGVQALMLLNVIGVFIAVFTGSKAFRSNGTAIVLSIAYFFLISPLFIHYSFFTLYDALKRSKAVNYICFLITYAIYGLWVVSGTIGGNTGGTLGLISIFDVSPSSATGAFIFALLFSIGGLGASVAIGYTWYLSWRYYKTEGLEKKAFSEASRFAMQYAAENKDVIVEAAKENPEFVQDIANSLGNQ